MSFIQETSVCIIRTASARQSLPLSLGRADANMNLALVAVSASAFRSSRSTRQRAVHKNDLVQSPRRLERKARRGRLYRQNVQGGIAHHMTRQRFASCDCQPAIVSMIAVEQGIWGPAENSSVHFFELHFASSCTQGSTVSGVVDAGLRVQLSSSATYPQSPSIRCLVSLEIWGVAEGRFARIWP